MDRHFRDGLDTGVCPLRAAHSAAAAGGGVVVASRRVVLVRRVGRRRGNGGRGFCGGAGVGGCSVELLLHLRRDRPAVLQYGHLRWALAQRQNPGE